MSKDYKPTPERPKSSSKGSPLFTGMLIGFLLGIAASLAVIVFIKGGNSPFANLATPSKPLSEKIKDDAKNQEVQSAEDALTTQSQTTEQTNNASPNQTTPNKDEERQFDFYTILPNIESKVNTEEVKIKEEEPQTAPQATYFLQVGAFPSTEEADNLKAKLALQGFEAVVQTATIPDKGVWHRVRVGPLKNLDQINKSKADLASNGFKADLIKIKNENQSAN
ncbi:MAG: SPOR domain-containing protein [Methylotenera sp.]|nr:SPOR domain-containing protein [Methylotenera sp.]